MGKRSKKNIKQHQRLHKLERALTVLLGAMVVISVAVSAWSVRVRMNNRFLRETEIAQTEQEETSPLEQQLLEQMSIHEKICQMIIVAPEQFPNVVAPVTECNDVLKQALTDYPVGGLVYFEENLQSKAQIEALLTGLNAEASIGLFQAIDEEGGRVARLANSGIEGALSPTESMSECGSQGAERVEQVCQSLGEEIKAFGFNLNFAPVADINTNPNNTVIGNRAFSSSPEQAKELVAAAVQGFRESGVLCTLKHFPGHGDTEQDSHVGVAVLERTLEELRACELIPFQAGMEAGAELVMVGHIAVPELSEGKCTPASVSKHIITGLLKEELGFEGLVITDSMMMQAITSQYSADAAAVQAIQAGVDVLLMPEDLGEAVQGLERAVLVDRQLENRINESTLKILKMKIKQGIIVTDDKTSDG